MHELAHCHDEDAHHQLPKLFGWLSFWIIQIVSTEECSSLTQNLMQIHCSTNSVILNAMATQCTCSLNGVYRPHWLVQWSLHCSCMCIPVHSPWLPGYSDVMKMVLIILTMAGLFLDRPRITWKVLWCLRDHPAHNGISGDLTQMTLVLFINSPHYLYMRHPSSPSLPLSFFWCVFISYKYMKTVMKPAWSILNWNNYPA